jgi:hypothetical protein
MRTTIHLLTVSFVLCLLAAACRREEPNGPGIEPIIGKWTSVSYTHYWDVLPPAINQQTGADTGTLQLHCYAGGQFSLRSYWSQLANDTGRFQVSNGHLSLWGNFPNLLSGSELHYTDANTLTLSFTHIDEYPLNDTGATPVLGDRYLVRRSFTFHRQ